jgi:hypothetical protein
VFFAGGAVQADADALDAGFDHPAGSRLGDQGAVGRHDHPQPEIGSIASDIEYIRPQQGFSAGQNNDRPADCGDLIQQPQSGRCIQLAAIGTASGRRAAVHTVQVAVAGGFPGHEPQNRGFAFFRLGPGLGFDVVRMHRVPFVGWARWAGCVSYVSWAR